jgi:superfamily II DNA/RNA helicase
MSFSDLGLSPDILRAVAEAGYETPTPIQSQAIPIVLMGRDVLGCAQTGTGKTAGFTLPMIEILNHGRARARMPRSLILEPTRELAAQVAENFEKYGKYCELNYALLIGGESFVDQEKRLDRGVDVLIATPGRMIDLYERGKILLSDVKILVIDETDRMLDMGFIPDVEKIVSLLPKLRQTLFFSATMAPEIRRLADAFLMNPKEITVAPPATAASTVTQALAMVSPMDKREALRRLIGTEGVANALIFCNRKRDVEILFKSLTKHGFDAVRLHGDMPQPKRMETLDKFRRGEVRLMVCSDVAARGLDIKGLSHVFNFDVPIHAEDYIHRIGRTGRAGKEGRAFTFATPAELRHLAAIEKLIGNSVPRIEIEGIAAPAPGGEAEETRRPSRHAKRGDRSTQRKPAERSAPSEAELPHVALEQSRHVQLELHAALPELIAQPDQPARPNRHQRRAKGRDDAPADPLAPVRQGAPMARMNERASGRGPDRSQQSDAFGDHMPAFLLKSGRSSAAR